MRPLLLAALVVAGCALAAPTAQQKGGLIYVQDAEPTSDLAAGALWFAPGAGALKVLTTLSPAAWTALAPSGDGSGAPTDAQYWTGAADATLSAEKNLGALSTGLVLTTSGTPSAYGGTSCTNQFPRSLTASGIATCASVANTDLAGSIAASKLVGSDIATVGTITSGTWAGTAIAFGNGGTGLTTAADDTALVSSGSAWQAKALPDCDTAATSKLLYDTATNAWSCGTDQTGAGGSATHLVLAGDVSTGANVTLVDLTGMAFTADAGGVYEVALFGLVSSPVATTGFGFGVNCAQAPVLVALTGTSQLANTGTSSTWSAIANNAIVGVTSGTPTAGTIVPTHGGGMIRAHASSAGTCTFRFRSETTAVTTAKANTTITVTKVN